MQLRVEDWGRLPYAEAFARQKTLQQQVIAGRTDEDPSKRVMHLVLVEHDPPVITVSRRRGARRHLLASPAQLAAAGVEISETDRGGDVTYHGPGQLVVYPILDLNTLRLRLHSYMRFLEQVVIDVLASYRIEGVRDREATGVWAHASDDPRGTPVKICALGVRVSRWVSMHGLALNVHPDLAHFELIVPCGLAGRGVTSMRRLLGDRTPAMSAVKQTMSRVFQDAVRLAVERGGETRQPAS